MGKSPGIAKDNIRSDEHLVEEAKRGDDEAFSLLVTRHKHRIFRLGSRFARNAHELDDICQEVFIKAYEHLGKFRREAPFGHWLSRIAINVCYDALKKARHDRGNHLPMEDFPDNLCSSASEESDARHDAYETLMWGLARLRPDERIVITLLELEEKPVAEVAELTGWSEGNVRVRAHRARQALKKILEGHREA
ncbi:MAG: RNA polymerase sigma factor [Syntrophales bacterium]|nr:RNA polymerase sigma factor [Syntrophales bacterium]